MYSVIRETVIYSLYVMVLLFLCYTNRDTLAFYVSKSIRDNFVEGDAGENVSKGFTTAKNEKKKKKKKKKHSLHAPAVEFTGITGKAIGLFPIMLLKSRCW